MEFAAAPAMAAQRWTDDCLIARSFSFLTFTTTCIRVSSVNLTSGSMEAVMLAIAQFAIAMNGASWRG